MKAVTADSTWQTSLTEVMVFHAVGGGWGGFPFFVCEEFDKAFWLHVAIFHQHFLPKWNSRSSKNGCREWTLGRAAMHHSDLISRFNQKFRGKAERCVRSCVWREGEKKVETTEQTTWAVEEQRGGAGLLQQWHGHFLQGCNYVSENIMLYWGDVFCFYFS